MTFLSSQSYENTSRTITFQNISIRKHFMEFNGDKFEIKTLYIHCSTFMGSHMYVVESWELTKVFGLEMGYNCNGILFFVF